MMFGEVEGAEEVTRSPALLRVLLRHLGVRLGALLLILTRLQRLLLLFQAKN
jgi:hypothetical protein